MKPGSYYYSFLPPNIQWEFKNNAGRKFEASMDLKHKCLIDFIKESFNPMYTFEGSAYWDHVAAEYRPSFKSFIVSRSERHAVKSLSTLLGIILIVSIIAGILFTERNDLQKIVKDQDSVNAANKATLSIQREAMNKAIWLPDTSAIKGRLNEDNWRVVMDSQQDMDTSIVTNK